MTESEMDGAPLGDAEPTLEDRFAALGEEGGAARPDDPEEENESAADDRDGADPIEQGSGEEEGKEEEPETLPDLTAPASWNAAEKEEFRRLPRVLQETLSRRETERERFVQAKAQEARAARTEVEREALATIQQLQANYAQHLQHFESQLAVPEPDPRLIAEDPELYAAQLQRFRYYAAQRHQAQQLLAEARQRSAFAARETAAREAEQIRSVLADAFPEYLDPSTGPRLKQELGSTAVELGYTPEQLADVDHVDILAMRKAHEWRQDAIKYRALMAKKMDGVRAARDMPRVSRPGTSSGRGAAESQRYAADRQKMRSGDRDAAVRTFARFL
jgi:hypothetical protein